MTKQAEGSFFRFDSKSEITWMQDKERAGLRELLTRADCHGGENDIFFLCLKEKNILARVERDEKTKNCIFWAWHLTPHSDTFGIICRS